MDIETVTEIELAGALLSFGADALGEWCSTFPQVECPVQHHFGPGVYVRECAMPAGSIVVGHYHRQSSLNVMLKGRMVLLVDGQVTVIEAPYMTISGPGRKAAYVLEDVVWQNIWATEETDIEKLEDMFVDKHAAINGGLAA